METNALIGRLKHLHIALERVVADATHGKILPEHLLDVDRLLDEPFTEDARTRTIVALIDHRLMADSGPTKVCRLLQEVEDCQQVKREIDALLATLSSGMQAA